MVFKIKTSKKTMNQFQEIEAREKLAPFILSKLAISMSVKTGIPLTEEEMNTDNYGLELNRQTITSEYDALYKCLIEIVENKHLNDEEYFQIYLKGHLDRGANIIYSEFKYSRDLISQLLREEISL